jgi:hypothetical protein
MYLVRGNTIVAYNDDYADLASEIIYTATESGSYRLVIRAYTTSTPGYCDLYLGINGAAPTQVDHDLFFGGTYVNARWKQDEWFETKNRLIFVTEGDPGGYHTEDPFLYLIYDGMMYWDDDTAGNFNSKVVPPSSGSGIVVVSSYSRYSGGQCALALVGTSYLAPWLSPAPWSRKLAPDIPSDRAKKYLSEFKRLKPGLERSTPRERDQKILELQRQLLSEEEIRAHAVPMPEVTHDFVHRQEQFKAQYKKLERSLNKMSPEDRVERLVRMKREAMGDEYSELKDFAAPVRAGSKRRRKPGR